MKRALVLVGVAAAVAGCWRDRAASLPDAPPADGGGPVPGDGGGPGGAPPGCADLFAQDVLPTYRVEIAREEWAKLEDEFLHRAEREAAGLDVHPWHPIVFRHGDEVVRDAMIRLHGMSSWLLAVQLDPDPKMQFVISFNQIRREGRFHGLRKIVLDMPRNDRTFLRQRLALAFFRDLGVAAQCANNARLEINGAYYGLYTNLERLDRELLRRAFPGEDDGDLWESGRELETNERTADRARRDALFAATSVEQIAPLVDLEASVQEWAAEAMLPNSDGYYGGTPKNFYLYDHPSRGFVWLPYDLDGTFDFRPPDVDPWLWSRSEEPALHYRLTLSSRPWMERYVDALERALAAYDVPRLEERLASWATQIATAAAEDPKKPFSTDEHRRRVAALSAFFEERAEFVRRWIDCRREGGPDPDGDGFAWCLDCAEGDPAAHPGAAEAANGLDDDCDGRVDEGG